MLARMTGPLAWDDPFVLDVLRNYFLDPPSNLPYNLTNHIWLSSGKYMFTWPWIYFRLHKLFSGQRGGFFVEAGALDGEYLSNTLWLEEKMGWSGLLIEADSVNYRTLKEKRRKAWSSSTCLSSELYPKEVVFVSRYAKSKGVLSPYAARSHGHELRDDINQTRHDYLDDKSFSVTQCFPLASYLAALNVSTVDLLSLDIQGIEVSVLRNFLTSSNIPVRVIVAENEYNTFDDVFLKFMVDKGYIILAAAIDYLFVKKDDPVLMLAEVQALLNSTFAT
ncbi:protein Star-like [Cherax quadricarinatus]|uniref:protein Star-like n=1 Tax=Cherax quadricarinatus TaxID=27406 RepID=UPI00387E7008